MIPGNGYRSWVGDGTHYLVHVEDGTRVALLELSAMKLLGLWDILTISTVSYLILSYDFNGGVPGGGGGGGG